jgi:hypothetical protein
MRKICEWSKCKEIASGQGLIKKDINKQYKWFCGDHLKIHNKTNIFFQLIILNNLKKKQFIAQKK